MSVPSQVSSKERFKHYLKRIGSGENTSKGITRAESADALELILEDKVSPAQIGAFMIAHRIRRPEPQELAGMLDTYLKLGPNLQTIGNQKWPICFGMPFDGRNRTSPIYPLTSLVLISANQPVVLHGGKRMPIKYGITCLELFHSIGLNLEKLSLQTVQNGLTRNGFALIHQPDHFALADNLISYRDDIGKRPPIASMELIWTAHQGKHLLVSGFVHPPTEERAWSSLEIKGEENFLTVKGLEGSTDLPTSRACITAHVKNNENKRLILHPRDYQCYGEDMKWSDIDVWKNHALEALKNEGPLKDSLRWNAGVYLWLSGITNSLSEGIKKAEWSMQSGAARKVLDKLIQWRENIRASEL